jgi:hypothetical protein
MVLVQLAACRVGLPSLALQPVAGGAQGAGEEGSNSPDAF